MNLETSQIEDGRYPQFLHVTQVVANPYEARRDQSDNPEDLSDRQEFATCSPDGNVMFWKFGAKHPTRRFESALSINQIAFHPTERILAIADDADALRLVQVDMDYRKDVLLPHPDSVTLVAFSSDGALIATACADRVIRIWEPGKTGWKARSQTFRHDGDIRCLTFDQDGVFLASGTLDNKVFVFEAKTGRPIAPAFRHLGSEIQQLRFSSAVPRRVIAANIHRAWIWPLEPPKGVEDELVPDELVAAAEWELGERVLGEGVANPVNPTDDIPLMSRLPDFLESNESLAARRVELYVNQKDWANAVLAAEVLDKSSNNPPAEVYYHWARALEGQQKYSDALEKTDLAISGGYEPTNVIRFRSQLLRSLKRYDEAVETYSKVDQRILGLAQPLLEKGYTQATAGQWREAATTYDEATEMGLHGLKDGLPMHNLLQRMIIEQQLSGDKNLAQLRDRILSDSLQRPGLDTDVVVAQMGVVYGFPSELAQDFEERTNRIVKLKPVTVLYRALNAGVQWRSGRFELALQILDEDPQTRSLPDPSHTQDDLNGLAYAWLIRAHVEKKLNRDSYSDSLQKAKQCVNAAFAFNMPPMQWNRRLLIDRLLTELEAQ